MIARTSAMALRSSSSICRAKSKFESSCAVQNSRVTILSLSVLNMSTKNARRASSIPKKIEYYFLRKHHEFIDFFRQPFDARNPRHFYLQFFVSIPVVCLGLEIQRRRNERDMEKASRLMRIGSWQISNSQRSDLR